MKVCYFCGCILATLREDNVEMRIAIHWTDKGYEYDEEYAHRTCLEAAQRQFQTRPMARGAA
jgi:hypothetical protein